MKYLFYSVVAICITVVLLKLIAMYGIINVILGILLFYFLLARFFDS